MPTFLQRIARTASNADYSRGLNTSYSWEYCSVPSVGKERMAVSLCADLKLISVFTPSPGSLIFPESGTREPNSFAVTESDSRLLPAFDVACGRTWQVV